MAPEPLYPGAYAQATGIARSALDDNLDQLRLAGLIRLTDWVKDRGQGYTITPAGESVLENARLLQRLRRYGASSEPPPAVLPAPRERAATTPWSRGEAVRAVILEPARPIVTQVLIIANLLLFFVGMIRASEAGVMSEFLGGSLLESREDQRSQATRAVDDIRHDTGALTVPDLAQKREWWRLVSYAFVHGGWMHLLMNMLVLFSLGPLLENMWGAGRYLVLYLIAGVCAGCLALILNPDSGIVGASGSLCGLLTSMLVWRVGNSAHLPADYPPLKLILFDLVLITFISFWPGISWAGHLGGAVAGALLGVPLLWLRFGTATQRWLGLAGVVAVPLLFLLVLYVRLLPFRPADPTSLKLLEDVNQRDRWASQLEVQHCRPVLRKIPSDRWDDPDETIVRTISAARDDFRQLGQKLADAAPCANTQYATGLQLGSAYLDGLVRYYELLLRCVTDNRNWTAVDEEQLKSQVAEVSRLRQGWRGSPFLVPRDDARAER